MAMHVLRSLPKKTNGMLYVMIMTDRCYKLKQAVPTIKTSRTYITNILLDNCIVPYGITSCLLTDNGTKSVSEVFEATCYILRLMHLITTAYHLHRTQKARLLLYEAEHQCDLTIFVQPLPHAYTTQVVHSTGTTLFRLLLSRHPPGPTTFDHLSSIPTDAKTATTPADIRWEVIYFIAVRR